MYEPLMLTIALGFSLQEPTLSTFSYVFIIIFGMLPMILTREITKIKLKWFLSCLICLISVPFFIAKLVMMIKYNRDPGQHKDSMFMHLLGVYEGMTIPMLIIDIVVGLIIFILIFHYSNQKKQALTRITIGARQDY